MKTDLTELDREIDNARRRIAAAQLAMAEKLESVEKQIRNTVAGAESAVDDVVSSVKGTISETVDSVKQTFDLPHQTRQHPWLVFGSAVLAGYLLGGRGAKAHVSQRNGFDYNGDPDRHRLQPGLASGVLNQFKGEIGSLRSAAVGAIITALWEIAKQSLSAPNGQPSRHESSRPRRTGKPVEGQLTHSQL